MHISPASVSANPAGADALIVGPSWLGDSIMAMPALQAYAKAFPAKRIVLLVKPKLTGLWNMQPAVAEVWASSMNFSEIWPLSAQIRRRRFAAAFILPNSFRSALIPFLGRVPERVGLRGHFRSGLLTKIMPLPESAGNAHQKYEALAVFGLPAGTDELPCLQITAACLEKARTLLDPQKRWIGLTPGAARGPAKRWPAEYFSELGRILSQKHQYQIVVFGHKTEEELCCRICAASGVAALNLAGETTLPELAALFSCCTAVIGNDSGGIHLAAAVGAPVIAIYGVTDPDKTRPLGRKVVVLQKSSRRSRDIPRCSDTAEKSLKKISPQTVAEALLNLTAD